jgi:hypothetical protein
MDIDEAGFRHIYRELVEENPLACRAVLSICRINFTANTRSLAVTLGRTPELLVNLDFLRTNCHTPSHVRAVLLHEFLHVLLGHTLKWEAISRCQNVALDAIINAIIHRKMGSEYSSMMAGYYKNQKGTLRLLRPMTDDEMARARNQSPQSEGWGGGGSFYVDLDRIHAGIYSGTVLADDVLEIAEQLSRSGSSFRPEDYKMLLGGHEIDGGRALSNLPEEIVLRLKYAAESISSGVLTGVFAEKSSGIKIEPKKELSLKWIQLVEPFFRELLVNRRSKRSEVERRDLNVHYPTPEDRRRCVLVQKFPLLCEFRSSQWVKKARGVVNVYLDVSASMDAVLPHLVGLLIHFREDLVWPLWTFSTKVDIANFSNRRLCTSSTGGTRIQCVFDHLSKSKSRKALIISDGYIEADAKLSDPGDMDIRSLITPGGSSRSIENLRIRCLKLPPS